MADDRNKRGRQDRARVSRQRHEIDYLRRKFKVSTQQVVGALRAVGSSRKRVEGYLRAKA